MIVILDTKQTRHVLSGGETITLSVLNVGYDEYRIQLCREPSNPIGKIYPLYTTRRKSFCHRLAKRIDEQIKSGGVGGIVFVDIPYEVSQLIAEDMHKAEGSHEAGEVPT